MLEQKPGQDWGQQSEVLQPQGITFKLSRWPSLTGPGRAKLPHLLLHAHGDEHRGEEAAVPGDALRLPLPDLGEALPILPLPERPHPSLISVSPCPVDHLFYHSLPLHCLHPASTSQGLKENEESGLVCYYLFNLCFSSEKPKL